MNLLKSINALAVLALAAVLAGCGGSGTSVAQHSQQAGQVSTGGDTGPVAADFIKVAQQEPCGDIRNRLYLIDGKEVFWDRAGNCPDNAYVQRLYGANPQAVLCEMTDTLGGPRTFCANDSMRALFQQLQSGVGQPNLGLDASHKVELIPFLPKSGTAIAFQTLVQDAHSSVIQQRQVVVRDQAAYDKLWAEHVAGRDPAPAAPPVDFSTRMAVAVFAANTPGCGSMGIAAVRSQDGKMVVDVERRASALPVCTALLLTPMQMVVVDRNDAPAEFVWHDVQSLPVLAIDASNVSGVHDQRQLVIKDQSTWAALWVEHAGKDKPRPQVDFTTQMVIGVFRGMGGNGCNTTSISSVTSDGAALTVRYVDTVPGIGIMCAMYVPSPAQLVAVPRSDLPVRFAGETRILTP